MNLKSKNYNRKDKYNAMEEDIKRLSEFLNTITISTIKLKRISKIIYVVLIIALCQIMWFSPLIIRFWHVYSKELSFYIILLLFTNIFSLIGIFYIYRFDRIKRHEMIEYEIFVDFIEKKVKFNKEFEKIIPLETRIFLRDFLDSCNLILTNSSIGSLIYLLIFIFIIFFNTFLIIGST